MSVKKHIPNTITLMNAVCGSLGVVAAFMGWFDQAFILMAMAALFDFCDGLSARLLHSYSDMGKELDSLCDLVSFGVLPAVMLCRLQAVCAYSQAVWCYVPMILVPFSALRLAKFNVDPRQGSSFIGLATPACALLCGALCVYVCHEPGSFLSLWCCGPVFLPVASIVLSWLLVCEVPTFSFKFSRSDSQLLKGKRLAFAVNVVLISAIVALLGTHWSLAVVLSVFMYILMNIVFRLLKI